MLFVVTDALVTTWGTTITVGGGAKRVLAYYNGTQWIIVGSVGSNLVTGPPGPAGPKGLDGLQDDNILALLRWAVARIDFLEAAQGISRTNSPTIWDGSADIYVPDEAFLLQL
jgi:hypothetical protein